MPKRDITIAISRDIKVWTFGSDDALDQWYEFNDETVTLHKHFDFKLRCFGGDSDSSNVCV